MFVGRERELGELVSALPDRGAGGGLFLIAGEPGIGKTRLAAELAGLARGRGVRAVWGRCWEAGGAPSYWPWREALEALGGELPDPGGVGASDPAEARFALFRQVVAALAAAATAGPFVIVLEDIHAADRSTLLLLEFVADKLRAMPAMIVATYRDLEARLRADAADALSRLARTGHVSMLARLGKADVSAIVRAEVAAADDSVAAAVYDMTHGNPLFVAEVVRDVRARGLDRGVAIPLGVREVIRQRLAFLPGPARRALEAGAVLGIEHRRADVARIVPDAAAGIDDAVDRGLVIETAGRLRFSHALYREALYHDLTPARRGELHRDAARALGVAGATLAEIAHHLLEAGPEAAGDAVDAAIRAAEQALGLFAFEDAALLLERARLAVPASPDGQSLRARVLIATGEARIRGGESGARELCVEAADIARQLDDSALLARSALAYGAVFTMGVVDPVMVALLEEALARLPERDAALRAQVMARLAAARQPSVPERRTRDIDLAIEAVEMARRVAGPRELLGVLHWASGALYGQADPRIRLRNSREQERLAEELGDITRLLQARVRIAMDLLELGDFTSYAELATAYERTAAPIGNPAGTWRVPLMRSMVAIVGDRFDESERYQAQSRQLDSERPAARRAQALHRIGFLRAAERHAELRASIGTLRSVWLGIPFPTLAEPRVAAVLAHIGDDDEARVCLDAVSDAAFSEPINHCSLAQAIWLTGDVARARRLLPELGWLAGRWVMYWLDTEIADTPPGRWEAYLHGILGDWREADRLFAGALAAVEAIGYRSLAARMRFEMGDLLRRFDREPARAHALLAEARERAHALGLPELVALIDRRAGPHRDAAAAGVGSAPAPALALVREGEYYSLAVAAGPLRFKATRGMQYLAELLERPGVDVHVLELVGSADHADRGNAGDLVDPAALRAYRRRLDQLRAAADDAELVGDVERAERARDEMEQIAAELGRSSGRGGRARRGTSAVDRARSAVQRRIKDAIDRIAAEDAAVGDHLRRSIRTGITCCYRPVR